MVIITFILMVVVVFDGYFYQWLSVLPYPPGSSVAFNAGSGVVAKRKIIFGTGSDGFLLPPEASAARRSRFKASIRRRKFFSRSFSHHAPIRPPI